MNAAANSPERILLVRRHRRPLPQLLRSAVELARRSHARLTFVHSLEGVGGLDELSKTELLAELRALISPHLGGLAADYRLVSGDLAAAAELAAGQHGLIFPALGGPGSEAEERELERLLRTSPLPVWLDSGRGRAPRGILAAVDLQTRNPLKLALNLPIVRRATRLAASLGSRLDLLTVRTPLPTAERLARRVAGIGERRRLSRKETRAELAELLAEALRGAPPLAQEARLLVAQGEPERLIAQAAESASTDLLVAGCLGRSGLAGWLLGDTVSRLSERLACSILAIKPSRELLQTEPRDDRSRAA